MSTTTPSNEYEKWNGLHDVVPRSMSLPCTIHYEDNGFVDVLSRGAKNPVAPKNQANGTVLRYHEEPFTQDEAASDAAIVYDWVVVDDTRVERDTNGTRTAKHTAEVVAEVDPEHARVQGATYRVDGCTVADLVRTPSGTWLSVCDVDQQRPRGVVVQLTARDTSLTDKVGLDGVCPGIAPTSTGLWLYSRGAVDATRSQVLRVWRVDPATGAWLTLDVPSTSPRITPANWNPSDALFRLAGTGSFGGIYTLTGDPPQNNGPVPLESPPADSPPVPVTIGFAHGLVWSLDGGRRVVGVDARPQLVHSYDVPDLVGLDAGPAGILVQTARRDPSGATPPDAIITVSRLDPDTGALTHIAELPAIAVDESRGGPPHRVGFAYGFGIDQTGGWMKDGSGYVRLPNGWFS